MQIRIDIFDELAQRLNGEWGSISRRLLEVFVAEAYRYGALSTAEVRYSFIPKLCDARQECLLQ
jgi:hypothetical protein